MTPQHALLRTIRDTPIDEIPELTPHPETLRALIRKGLAVSEYTLALTDKGRAEIAHLGVQNCQGCVWLFVARSKGLHLCFAGRHLPHSKRVNLNRPSPRWCPGKVRPVIS